MVSCTCRGWGLGRPYFRYGAGADIAVAVALRIASAAAQVPGPVGDPMPHRRSPRDHRAAQHALGPHLLYRKREFFQMRSMFVVVCFGGC